MYLNRFLAPLIVCFGLYLFGLYFPRRFDIAVGRLDQIGYVWI